MDSDWILRESIKKSQVLKELEDLLVLVSKLITILWFVSFLKFDLSLENKSYIQKEELRKKDLPDI